ncbi:MAG: hypothetical protein ACT4QA_08775 [Panacagrimonas sp.]
MDPTTPPMFFSEPRILAPFGLALSLGLMVAAGWFLLRPWPPRTARAFGFTIVLLLSGVAIAWLLQERTVLIDTASREVVEVHGLLGWSRAERLAFAQISSVTVDTAGPFDSKTDPPPAFVLGLQTADRRIELDRFDDALQAEEQARVVAGSGAWPALRRGYRLETAAHGGDTARFETAAGQQGISLNLGDVIRVVEEAGAESAVLP